MKDIKHDLERIRALVEKGGTAEAERLAYEWFRTKRWDLRDFRKFLTLWVELCTTPIPSSDN